MTEPSHLSDSERLAAALKRIRGVEVTEAQVRSHVMRPPHLDGVSSDHGRLHLSQPTESGVETSEALPEVHLHFRLDVDGFIDSLESALSNEVAGLLDATERAWHDGPDGRLGLGQGPTDTAELWTTGIRMHVASLSKQITAIAMTRLLHGHGIPSDAKIIDHLPAYWAKGPNVDQITFAHLMTHTSGLNYGVSSSASDFEFMKGQIARRHHSPGPVLVSEHELRSVPDPARDDQRDHPDRLLPATAVWPERVERRSCGTSSPSGAYQSYVATKVFSPAGVSGPSLEHQSTDALAYNFPVSGSRLELRRSDHDGRRSRLAHLGR